MNKTPLSDDARALVNAFLIGSTINGIGGSIYDCKMNFLMANTDLYYAIKELEKHGVLVRRIDSGGRPTWNATLTT
jgi:hypothetical protein